MYSSHRLFEPPASDAVLWRYLNFTKFLSLLEEDALFFSRVDLLEDPFEGSFSRVNTKMRPLIYPKNMQGSYNNVYDHFKKLRRFTLVNCWHENTHESIAMWKIYSKENEGVAIKTNFSSLSGSFRSSDPENVYIGRVQYADYEEEFIPESNSMAPFMYKRKSFEYEHEVRALIQGLATSAKHEQDLSERYSQGGLYINVDIPTLIHEIVVAYNADGWFLNLVKSIAKRYDLTGKVRRSSLGDEPIWR